MILALALALAPPQSDAAWDDLRTRVEKSPQNVATFVERRAGCNHFSGEEPYDRERADEIAKALRQLRCKSLAQDERTLRRTYRKQPAVISLLKDTRELSGW